MASVNSGTAEVQKRRDASKTRQLLLDAALRRFARQGYAATTVRDIADDAGVNVALISRYFDSKEGLLEACLQSAVDELNQEAGSVALSQVPAAIAQQAAGSSAESGPNLLLLLLLRSAGDERAEKMRLAVLRRFSQRLATAAGWRRSDPDTEHLVLRAQLVLATAIGITLLRYSALAPLAAVGEEELVEPLRDVVNALLAGTEGA